MSGRVAFVGNYLDQTGEPVIATRAPRADDRNVVGGYASARGWFVRWIKACVDVEVFAADGDSLQWDHARVRVHIAPGSWLVWTGREYVVVEPDQFARDYTPVVFEAQP